MTDVRLDQHRSERGLRGHIVLTRIVAGFVQATTIILFSMAITLDVLATRRSRPVRAADPAVRSNLDKTRLCRQFDRQSQTSTTRAVRANGDFT